MHQSSEAVYDWTPDFAEFLRLADLLEMPEIERRNILAMSLSQWTAWVGGSAAPFGAEQRRRLGYAVGVMRRAAANLTGTGA